jgi:hypothetical protein
LRVEPVRGALERIDSETLGNGCLTSLASLSSAIGIGHDSPEVHVVDQPREPVILSDDRRSDGDFAYNALGPCRRAEGSIADPTRN